MLVSSRRFAHVRSRFVLPVLPVLQIRQARNILRHVNTRHKHKVFGACGRACRRSSPSLLVFFCLLVHSAQKKSTLLFILSIDFSLILCYN